MILVTGGTGFIGSHACVALAQAGHEVLILDNLCNSRADVVDRLAADLRAAARCSSRATCATRRCWMRFSIAIG
jgi:UDP-glucose 4-epimerase